MPRKELSLDDLDNEELTMIKESIAGKVRKKSSCIPLLTVHDVDNYRRNNKV